MLIGKVMIGDHETPIVIFDEQGGGICMTSSLNNGNMDSIVLSNPFEAVPTNTEQLKPFTLIKFTHKRQIDNMINALQILKKNFKQ